MAEEIQDIPLDIEEMIQPEETIPAPMENISPVELEVSPPAKARPKGRPAGAKNKGPSKPRAKKKTQIQEAPVEYEAESPPPYEPSSPKRNLKLPTDPSSSDVAAAMLKLLQDQSYSRQSRKQRLYNSWFQ